MGGWPITCHSPTLGATRMTTSAVSAVRAAPAYISLTARTTDRGAGGAKLVDVVRFATGRHGSTYSPSPIPGFPPALYDCRLGNCLVMCVLTSYFPVNATS